MLLQPVLQHRSHSNLASCTRKHRQYMCAGVYDVTSCLDMVVHEDIIGTNPYNLCVKRRCAHVLPSL